VDHIWQHKLLQPCKYAVFTRIWRAVRPEICRRATKASVKIQSLTGERDGCGDVAAMRSGEGGAIEGGVVVEREKVVVDVASGISGRGKHRKRVMCGGKIKGTGSRFAASGEPGNRHEADGFHVPAAFEGVSFAIVFHVVTDMGVAAEELDGCVPLLAADGFVESVVFW